VKTKARKERLQGRIEDFEKMKESKSDIMRKVGIAGFTKPGSQRKKEK
jgi:hypothetical protein